MTRDIIQAIIDAGTYAPSGSNSQPWRFEVEGNVITIIALPEKDHPILNFHNRGTWFAHGGVVENMVIAAEAHNLTASVSAFPEKGNENSTARITLSEKKPKRNGELAPYIKLRTTNRKPYRKGPVRTDDIRTLRDAYDGKKATIHWIEDPERIEQIAKASSVAEILMLENRILHDIFLNHEVAWTREEERRRGGLYVGTMEIPPPAHFVLRRLLCHWPLMRLANKARFARMIARQNSATYASSGAIGIATVPNEDHAFLDAGRAVERVWLHTTQLGLSMQIIAGVVFFYQRIMNGEMSELSDAHVNMVKDAYRRIIRAAGIPETQTIASIFRVGKALPPTARSERLIPDILWK